MHDRRVLHGGMAIRSLSVVFPSKCHYSVKIDGGLSGRLSHQPLKSHMVKSEDSFLEMTACFLHLVLRKTKAKHVVSGMIYSKI